MPFSFNVVGLILKTIIDIFNNSRTMCDMELAMSSKVYSGFVFFYGSYFYFRQI